MRTPSVLQGGGKPGECVPLCDVAYDGEHMTMRSPEWSEFLRFPGSTDHKRKLPPAELRSYHETVDVLSASAEGDT
jgi:hypothetical protein